MTYTVRELTQADDFLQRHNGPSPDEVEAMLTELGLTDLDELLDAAVPDLIRTTGIDLPPAQTEPDVVRELRRLAGMNRVFTSMIGMGYYGTTTPAVIVRNVLENPGWYTAYTPYQPEISQGRLEALLNFQTMVSDLAGLDIANASLLDESTAAAEAMTMSMRLAKSKSTAFFVDSDCHPQTIDVVRTRAEPLGIEVVVGDPADGVGDVFGALVQYPGSSGRLIDLQPVADAVHEVGGLLTVAADLLALVAIEAPGALGADVVVGSAQRFGVPMGFGGPHAGFIAVRDEFKRSIPGRIVGVSVDDAGRTGFRLALQTREQHIRREKATSNICTAQVLLAVMAGMYAVYHGRPGLEMIARRVHRIAATFADGVGALDGVEIVHDEFFDTVLVRSNGRADELVDRARERRINIRRVDDDTVGVAFDETTTQEDLDDVLTAFGARVRAMDSGQPRLPESLVRTTPFLDHPVFEAHRSETEMLRYLRRLADKDIALDRSMIPLGSCTMKLNATTEMEPITWREFAHIHPFAPRDQVAGYLELIRGLEDMLAELTGYDAVSLQPNAGSQGEYAGLLAIRAYHRSRGEGDRKVCLIPASAHGTNPASAAMAGMRVVVVATDDDGNIDIEDLRAKAAEHSDSLAALMITYPSTHGVFESTVRDVCKLIHDHGGQVYLDGANLNALVGVAKPGEIGSDVSHLNLHKTFTIPHGGGGPGVGPIGVMAHLAPFLPNHPVVPEAGPDTGVGAISAAPWGSAGILPIPYAYIKLMGSNGLFEATKLAILGANYIARRLAPHYPVLYTGVNGMVAHECIIDLRQVKDSTGVSAEDVAKRLIDYGFHAPTLSFPVAGTLMIEPTESESKAELDRFCDAMIQIKAEIDAIAAGEQPQNDNLLHNAPHPAEDLLAAEWTHPYSREEAAYPVESLRRNKYWVPIGRVDAKAGDRNVICACPPIESYM
ncbi:MAG: aminomethyl-transferring glycine dehydrogenase [Acidimicrobiia bacterium]|nr:aminomethyl-transferring glycine dehydrogenase [Acidimicrobiia bacterium]